MFKREIIFHDVLDKLPEKYGQYLCITKGWLTSDFELLRFAKNTDDLFILSGKDNIKNVWYYSDSEYGDVIVDRVLWWSELPNMEEFINADTQS